MISPFNFPAMVPLWFVPVAIAAGNTVVLKPSEKDPSASLWLARLWEEAGLPAGVFNVVQGDAEAVDALLTHPDIEAVSFVGSTGVARHVYETAAVTGKRVQALGGAKNHMVVLPDADLDAAADAAVSAGFGSAGERCMAMQRAGRRRPHRRRPRGPDRRPGAAALGRRPVTATSTWARWSLASTATGWRPTSTPPRPRAASSSSTAATGRWTVRPRASGWARPWSTT